MAVYTQLGAEDVAAFLAGYDAGELITLKGIAEGVENSNFFVETTTSRYILTLYENRVNPADLPFFHALLAHVHAAGCAVPRFMTDRDGQWLQEICGRPACLIEFLPGISVMQPTAPQARSTGRVLGNLHSALEDFAPTRPNSLGLEAWRPLAGRCDKNALEAIAPGLSARIASECDYLETNWPENLPESAIHADLFPDNVLMLGDDVTGVIDFYFACTEIRGYDLAVTHSAWAFSPDGREYREDLGSALIDGYKSSFPMDTPTRDAMPTLLRGAALRFLLTRCYDWINTPADALVTRKDPVAFLRRLDYYSDPAHADALLGQLQ